MKISLSRALMSNPQILILDNCQQVLSSLDQKKLIKEMENKTVIMLSDDLDYLKMSIRKIKIFDGKASV